MPALHVILDGDGAWPDLAERKVLHLAEDARFEITGLVGGMTSGRESIAFRIDLPDGQVVLLETSWRLFHIAHQAFAARFGVPD